MEVKELFETIFSDEKFHLPINTKTNGYDYLDKLESLFNEYKKKFSKSIFEKKIKGICYTLIEVVKKYLSGFPAEAFKTFSELMTEYDKENIDLHEKSFCDSNGNLFYNDLLNLFRITYLNKNEVNEENQYKRSRIFHVPFNLRSKIATSRYSIAGYPCLYLGTNLDLCALETNYKSHKKPAIASRFKLVRDFNEKHVRIRVMDIAVKPQDYLDMSINRFNSNRRFTTKEDPKQIYKLYEYFSWYPLIAACSFIRTNINRPFAAEYIIPQLLMQWVRKRYVVLTDECNDLIGIRYFSCKSIEASNKGFNYVFSSIYEKTENNLCQILSKAFKLTKPCYLNKSKDLYLYEQELNHADLDFVD